MTPLLQATRITKTFTLHTQGGIQLPVLTDVSLQVFSEECVSLSGPSGSGKSTLMRCLIANYRVDSGSIWVQHQSQRVDLTCADSNQLLAIRLHTIGYVSQFLRVIPRVPTLDVVIEPLLDQGVDRAAAEVRAQDLLSQLNISERLWSVSPTTFSGGEKQRINIARTLLMNTPILLLDEPTAALDPVNRDIVIRLIQQRQASGCAVIGIFHDQDVKQQLCNREFVFGVKSL